jgi:acetyltransferase-like isoleucine patch superfamily enzyme
MISNFKKKIKLLKSSQILSRHNIGLVFINFFFQRVLRNSSRFKYQLHFSNKVSAADKVKLVGEGNNAERCLALNGGILIQGSNYVFIDKTVLIAPGVKIISGNHDLDDFKKESVISAPLKIHENCWLGANAIVLPGVTLLKGTIVGAGSVVVKSFDRGNITVAGNPARVIKERDKI